MAKKVTYTEVEIAWFALEATKAHHVEFVPQEEGTYVMDGDFRIVSAYQDGIYGFRLESFSDGAWVNASADEIQKAIQKCEWALSMLTPPGS